jgi:2-haloalkanoic acid dehalogenase type II
VAIHAVVFDAYGTLYDVQSVRSLAIDLCGDKGELITQLWRLKQLEYTWLRGLMRCYQDLWLVTRASLEYSLTSVGIAPDSSLCDRLMDKYLKLDLHAEAEQALDVLRDHKLAILSNGSPKMLDSLVARRRERRDIVRFIEWLRRCRRQTLRFPGGLDPAHSAHAGTKEVRCWAGRVLPADAWLR